MSFSFRLKKHLRCGASKQHFEFIDENSNSCVKNFHPTDPSDKFIGLLVHIFRYFYHVVIKFLDFSFQKKSSTK